jgi:hypothetical protein
MVTSATQGAMASLDGGAPSEVPLIDEVKPGKHHVRIVADGYFDEERDLIAAPGSVAALDVSLPEKPALLTVETDASASVTVDGRPVAATPMAGPVEVPAGSHFVALTKNGYKAFTREVVLERGRETKVPAKLESSGQRTVAWVVLGTGAAGLVAGGIFTGMAIAQQNSAQNILDAQGRGNIPPGDVDTYRSAVDARDQWRTASIITFGAAAGVLAVGGALWLFDKPSVELSGPAPEAPPKPTEQPKHNDMEMGLLPWVGPGGAGVMLRGRL